MFRVPKSFVFLFVSLSVITAFVITKISQKSKDSAGLSGETSLSSTSTPQELSEQIREIISAGKNIPNELKKIGASGAQEIYNCNCINSAATAGIDSPYFQFEDPANCGEDRNYLESGLSQIPPIIRDERAKRSSDFPRACMTYILRKFMEGTETKTSSLFATCPNPTGAPQRGVMKPCVSKSYVNSIYNTFGDLSTCFNVPQRDFLPKLYNESGLHMNALGGGYDVGTSQLVGPAIEHANGEFQKYKQELLTSQNPACQRLAPILKNLKAANDQVAHRCELILAPENPILNIFYLMVKYKQDRGALQYFMNRPDINIFGRMKELGLKESDYDKDQLMQMMMILSFNAGAKSAAINFKNYLEAVKHSKRKLTVADFQFGQESFIYLKVKPETGILTRNPKDDDNKWAERKRKFEDIQNRMSAQKLKYRPTVEKITAKDEEGNKYSTYKLKWSSGQLSFPAYLMLYQSSGSHGYLSFVKRAGDELNNVFKEGTCVPDSYLSL